jgi:ABC-2 type transport system permease protein
MPNAALASERDSRAAVSARPATGGFLLATATLWEREIVRFLRQPSRIIGLVAAPLLFWLLLGSGLGDSFRPQNPALGGSLQYLFPGTVVMVVLFASVSSNMSTIEDRREGYLLSVLAAPISRASLVLGKILGGTTQAVIPGLLFFLLAPLAGFRLSFPQALAGTVVLGLIALALTSVGFCIAWWMDSAQGFHAILNLVLMPAWVLSGALFPPSGASGWVQAIMQANPVSYEVEALREVLMRGTGQLNGGALFFSQSLTITALFALAAVAAALIGSGRPSTKHLS